MRVMVSGSDVQTLSDIFFCLRMRYPGVEIVPLSGERATLHALELEEPDMLLVDCVPPPGESAEFLDLIGKVRALSDVPVMVLYQAETSGMEIAKCLEIGADECIAKPIEPVTFLAFVGALLRRCNKVSCGNNVDFSLDGKLTVNSATREVLVSNKLIKLTPTEFKLLVKLVRNEGKVLTHRNLLEAAWGLEDDVDSSFVKKYIYRLRSKLEPDADSPKMLLTERGIGYRFVKPV